MTVQEYKQRLLDLEKRLSRHISDEREQAREQVLDSPRDAADDSVADEDESVDFAVAELDTTVLEHIRDALQRIEDGTFGRCVVDGEHTLREDLYLRNAIERAVILCGGGLVASEHTRSRQQGAGPRTV